MVEYDTFVKFKNNINYSNYNIIIDDNKWIDISYNDLYKNLSLLGYIEAKGLSISNQNKSNRYLSIDSTDYPDINKINSIQYKRITYSNIFLYDYYTFNINDTYYVNIVLNFNYEYYLKEFNKYTVQIRGMDLLNSVSPIKKLNNNEQGICFGTGYNSIPFLSNMNFGSNNTTEILINPIELIINESPVRNINKEYIKVLSSTYRDPNNVLISNPTRNKMIFQNFDDIGIRKVFMRNIETEDEFYSVYSIIYKILTNNITEDCGTTLKINIPNNYTIPEGPLSNLKAQQAREIYMHYSYDLPTNLITNFKEIKVSEIGSPAFIVAYITNDDNCFIMIFDNFAEEKHYTTYHTTYNALKNYSYLYDTFDQNVPIIKDFFESLVGYNSYYLYSFGNYIHTVLDNLKKVVPDLSTTNVQLDGVSHITKNFDNYKTTWGINDIVSYSLLSDYKIFNVPFLDNINDIVSTNYMLESDNLDLCSHTIPGYYYSFKSLQTL